MTSEPAYLPSRLIRVVWDAGYGWPRCTRRARTARNFPTYRAAARQIAAIRAWPTHHVLVGVYETDALAWAEVDVDALMASEQDGDVDGGLAAADEA